eukprot:Filipodium_phascolosomae@DN2739_c0_g1_i6.p1
MWSKADAEYSNGKVLIDTGATIGTISSALAKALNLDVEAEEGADLISASCHCLKSIGSTHVHLKVQTVDGRAINITVEAKVVKNDSCPTTLGLQNLQRLNAKITMSKHDKDSILERHGHSPSATTLRLCEYRGALILKESQLLR